MNMPKDIVESRAEVLMAMDVLMKHLKTGWNKGILLTTC